MIEKKLLMKIENLRQELNQLGNEYGLQRSEMLKKSSELDELLNQYQRLKHLQQYQTSSERNHIYPYLNKL